MCEFIQYDITFPIVNKLMRSFNKKNHGLAVINIIISLRPANPIVNYFDRAIATSNSFVLE